MKKWLILGLEGTNHKITAFLMLLESKYQKAILGEGQDGQSEELQNCQRY